MVIRISAPYGEPGIIERLQQFLADPASRATTGLVFGNHEDAPSGYTSDIVDALVEHRDQLPHLNALFLGDIPYFECEISWIMQDSVTELFPAYPQLEHFGMRGNDCGVGELHSEHLKTLIFETGGLDRSAVYEVFRSQLPALEHLELWTGSENYGGDCTMEDFMPLLSGNLFPNLRYLGLRDSEFTDDLAIILSQSSLLERLHTLDLSLGTLSDVGAKALLDSAVVHKLAKLDLHHHFCSEEIMQRLQALPIEVDISDQQQPGDWADDDEGDDGRYVAVSE